MWTRKSDLEIRDFLIEKASQKKSLKRPLFIGSAFGLLLMFLNYLGFRGGARGVYLFSQPGGFGSRTLFVGAFGFVFFFGLAYYFQIKGSSFLSEEKYLRCAACLEISPTMAGHTCQCGGRLEPSEYYSWEE